MNEKDKEVLMEAVVDGTISDVKRAFKRHFRNTDKSYFDHELLQAAFEYSDINVIVHLLRNTSCRVSNPTEVQVEETLLHLAVELDNQTIINELINKDASIFDKNKIGETPLITAFKKKKLNAVHALLSHYNPNCKPDDKDEILNFQIACVTNNSKPAERYLKCGLNPNNPLNLDSKKVEYSGLNPVQFAAEKNNFTLFIHLLKYGGDVSVRNSAGLTPFHVIYYHDCRSASFLKTKIKQIFDAANHTKFINAKDSHRMSHFHMSCMVYNPNFAQVFVDNGENVNESVSLNCKINPGFTPLHFAVMSASDQVIELLLKNGANCNKQDAVGKTPLHLACKLSEGYRKLKIIQMLLDYNANPAIADKQGNTPLHIEFYYANNENKNRIFDKIFPKISGITNYTNDDGLSHFHIACTTKNINLVKDFLDSGINVNSCVISGIYSGYTALHFAALNNQKDVVEVLLEKKAHVNIKTKEFQVTPLHLACELNYPKFSSDDFPCRVEHFKYFPKNVNATSKRTNQLQIINLLLLHGAYVNAEDCQGITPLISTCILNKNYCKLDWSLAVGEYELIKGFDKDVRLRVRNIIQMLSDNKAQMNVCTNRKESILHIISKYSFLGNVEELVTLILNKGVDIDVVDDAGQTPLHVAVKANNLLMIQTLLDHKANFNIKCKNSKIPLHGLFSGSSEKCISSMDNNALKIFCALVEAGSDVNIQVGAQNKILLNAAISDRESSIVKKLLCKGADINLEDSSRNTCISSLLKWESIGDSDDSDYSDEEYYNSQSKSAQVFQIVYIHTQKLLALGLPVSITVQKICLHMYSKYKAAWLHLRRNQFNKLKNLDNIFLDCNKELEKLKLTKIDDYTSLYNILLKDEHQLIKDVKNDNFIKIIKDKMDKDFPLYYDLLKLQFRRGVMRSSLKHIAEETVFLLVNNLININLPDLCSDIIVKNLKNEDLANLKASILPKRSLKRKLSDDNDSSSSKRKR